MYFWYSIILLVCLSGSETKIAHIKSFRFAKLKCLIQNFRSHSCSAPLFPLWTKRSPIPLYLLLVLTGSFSYSLVLFVCLSRSGNKNYSHKNFRFVKINCLFFYNLCCRFCSRSALFPLWPKLYNINLLNLYISFPFLLMLIAPLFPLWPKQHKIKLFNLNLHSRSLFYTPSFHFDLN